MAAHYLLPCQCGKKNEVDSSQAGLQVRCECGVQLAVPTMRGLAGLERVERSAEQTRAAAGGAWGRKQGLMFLGGVLVIGAALIGLLFWSLLPNRPMIQFDYETLQRLSLEQSFAEWHELQKGVVIPEAEMHIAYYERVTDGLWQWEMVCAGFAALGATLIIVGLALPSNRLPTPRREAVRN